MHNITDNLYCINCAQFFVDHWTWLEGLRQFYQNWMDASLQKFPQASTIVCSKQENIIKFNPKIRSGIIEQNQIEYNKTTQTLTFRNQLGFPPKCMLLGKTSKKQNSMALGQYGEGMKLAIIVLKKADISVTIQSGDLKYYTTLKEWEYKYEQGRVLYIQTHPRQKKDNTVVTVKKITPQQFQEFRFLSLALMEPYSYSKITMGPSQLIIPQIDRMKGLIFKKGVRVGVAESPLHQKYEHYSYNLDIQIGRDRNCATNVQQVYNKQSQLHFNILLKHEQLKQDFPSLEDKLEQHLDIIYDFLKRNKYQTKYIHNYTKNSQLVCDRLYDKLLQQSQLPIAYPVYSTQHITTVNNQLRKYGLQPNFYPIKHTSWQIFHTLQYSKKYMSIGNKIKLEIEKIPIQELSQQQQNIMNDIKAKIVVLVPEITPFNFRKRNVQNVACFKDPTKMVIYINEFQLAEDRNKFIKSLLKMLLI